LEALEGNATARLRNSLAGLRRRDLMRDVEHFERRKDLMHALDDLKRGTLVEQKPIKFEAIEGLTEEDKEILQ
jgi:hypothetical protein